MCRFNRNLLIILKLITKMVLKSNKSRQPSGSRSKSKSNKNRQSKQNRTASKNKGQRNLKKTNSRNSSYSKDKVQKSKGKFGKTGRRDKFDKKGFADRRQNSDKNGFANRRQNSDKKGFRERRDKTDKKGFRGKSREQPEDLQQEQQEVGNQHQFEKARILKLSQAQQMQLINQTYHTITLQPQDNIKQIQKLFIITKASNLKVVASAIVTLAGLFCSIAPLQPVNMNEIARRTQVTITKDQFKILKFEKNLVQQYQRYIKMLKELNQKIKRADFQNDIEIYKKFKKCIFDCLQKCFESLWHFNFIKELLDIYVKFYHIQACQTAIKDFLGSNNIATMPVKSKLISSLAQIIIKKPQHAVPNCLVAIINNTYIDSKFLEKDRESLEYKKKQMKKRLYKQQAFEKKKQKQKNAENGTLQLKRKKKQEKAIQKLKIKQEVQKQFAEAEAVMSNKQLIRHTSAILQQLFYVYFKILVDKENSKFIRDALDGVLKFSHMINIQLISSLVQHLDQAAHYYRALWQDTKDLKVMETRLLIVFTAESIMNGPLSVYNMDDLKETKNLFKIIKDINQTSQNSLEIRQKSKGKVVKGTQGKQQKQKKGSFEIAINRQIFRLLILTVQQSLVKRRQLSQETVGSIVRELAILISDRSVPKMVILDLIRLLISRYHKVARMLEQDNQGFGINSYNARSEDPQSTNAINTSIHPWLKQALMSCSHDEKQSVSRIVEGLLKQNMVSVGKQRTSFEDLFNRDLGKL